MPRALPVEGDGLRVVQRTQHETVGPQVGAEPDERVEFMHVDLHRHEHEVHVWQESRTALGVDEAAQVVNQRDKTGIAQLLVRFRRGCVERHVQVDGTAEQFLDVPIGQDLPVRGHLQHLAAVAEGIEQFVDVLHHERLADRAIHQAGSVFEKGAPLRERVEVERRIDERALEVLVVVPFAVHARRLDVARTVEVDTQAARG